MNASLHTLPDLLAAALTALALAAIVDALARVDSSRVTLPDGCVVQCSATDARLDAWLA